MHIHMLHVWHSSRLALGIVEIAARPNQALLSPGQVVRQAHLQRLSVRELDEISKHDLEFTLAGSSRHGSHMASACILLYTTYICMYVRVCMFVCVCVYVCVCVHAHNNSASLGKAAISEP